MKLGAQGKRPEGAEPLLGNALEDESAKVRSEAFRTLWAWNEKEPQKALDRALDGRFPDLRLRAVEELAARAKEGWALERLKKAVQDRDAGVATAAYEAWVKLAGKEKPEPHLAALETAHASLRTLGAKNAVHAPAEAMRSPLLKLIQDEEPTVHLQALESLDKLIPNENGPLLAGLLSAALPLKVRAAELLAARGAEDIIEPMRVLITDKELERRYPPAFLNPLRARAASALATLGSRRLLSFYRHHAPQARAGRGARAGRPGPRHRQPPGRRGLPAGRARPRGCGGALLGRGWPVSPGRCARPARAHRQPAPRAPAHPPRRHPLLRRARPRGRGRHAPRPGGPRPRGAGDGVRHHPRAGLARLAPGRAAGPAHQRPLQRPARGALRRRARAGAARRAGGVRRPTWWRRCCRPSRRRPAT